VYIGLLLSLVVQTRRNTKIVTYSLLTDRGIIRDRNEDSLGDCGWTGRTGGWGGKAVQGVVKWAKGITRAIDGEMLRVAFGKVNGEIYEFNHRRDSSKMMAMTLTTSVFIKDKLIVDHVEDCRVYRNRGSIIQCLTTDHSESRHMLTRTIRAESQVKMDIYEHDVLGGDIYVQCSDRLYPQLSERELMLIAKDNPPEEACRKYVSLANERGGPDNITVQVIRT
jgi:serine/threonine protein phosphatase PrpC